MPARRRRPVQVIAACLALTGLTACDKPTPEVTLHSGGTTIHDDAYSFCFPGQDPAKEPGAEGACRFETEGRTTEVLHVRPGDEVLVDVDKDIADSGWYVSLRGADGKQSRLATQQEHTTSFIPDFTQSPTITLQVQKLSSPRDDARAVGVWQFALVPE